MVSSEHFAPGILFVITLVTRKIYERQAETIAKEGLIQDHDDKRLIGLQSMLLTVSLVALIEYIINPIWVSWSIIKLSEWLRWFGAAMGIIGTILLIWSHNVLEKYFRWYENKKRAQAGKRRALSVDQTLIYTAFIGLGIGFFLLIGNWLIGVTWLASIILALATSMNIEEAMMIEKFGDDYEKYRNQAGRFLSRIRLSRPVNDHEGR